MKTRIIENISIALYLSFIVLCGTAAYWWENLTSAETLIGWCICLAVLFAAVSGWRAFVRHGLEVIEWRATHRAIQYDARGSRQDENHLGYVSLESIREISKRGRNE